MSLPETAPAIVITAIEVDQTLWLQTLLGIEEEGIPWRWRPMAKSAEVDLIEQAWLAAAQSPLLVGLACDSDSIIVHFRNLPQGRPLFSLSAPQDDAALRQLGNNAARLVKGLPFKGLPPRSAQGLVQDWCKDQTENINF